MTFRLLLLCMCCLLSSGTVFVPIELVHAEQPSSELPTDEEGEKKLSHREKKIQQAIDSFSKDSNGAITKGLQAVVSVIKKDVRTIAGNKEGTEIAVAAESVQGDAPPREEAMSVTGKGTIEAMLGNLDKAIEYYRKAIATDPTFPTAYYNLGAAFARQGKTSHALSALNKAITLDPVYRSMAIRDKDYGNLHQNQEFLALVKQGVKKEVTGVQQEERRPAQETPSPE